MNLSSAEMAQRVQKISQPILQVLRTPLFMFRIHCFDIEFLAVEQALK